MSQGAVIKGPTVFKRDRDVEYTVFLPFDVVSRAPSGCRAAMQYLVGGIREVFQHAGIDLAGLDARAALIVDHVCSDPSMLKGTWR